MPISTFEVFKLGIGPSSSHTMGPMVAAGRFIALLKADAVLTATVRIQVKFFASLALTGKGHGSDRGVLLGLMGFMPATLDMEEAEQAYRDAVQCQRLILTEGVAIAFDPAVDFIWAGQERLPQHPNAMTFRAMAANGSVLAERTYFSVGGGFVLDADEIMMNSRNPVDVDLPYPFGSAAELLAIAAAADMSIADVMFANEAALRPADEIVAGLDRIAAAMDACIERGLVREGELPGGLGVKRRAKSAYRAALSKWERQADPLVALDLVSLWALAVNEENAAGGRIVTAPTNGAAGIVPAVLRFYNRFHNGTAAGSRTFLLTAGAVAALYKLNASISGAEVGCQGEVGVACSMAAAGLCAVLGGSNAQIENAAEIAMEHNLGLTCDPIGGLVQIPCIERNAMGTVKSIDAARLALLGDGQHSVSLDKVIATMKRTGADMSQIYKETSLGGLALDLSVNQVEC